jgi:phage gp46-like protein
MSFIHQDVIVTVDGTDYKTIPADLAPLARSVVISLFTWRRADPDDRLPDDIMGRLGWWGDATLAIVGDKFGSRLWLLARETITQETMARAKFYSEEALHWMIEDGIAVSVPVSVERMGLTTVALRVEIYEARGGRKIEMRFSNLWSLIGG